MPTQIGPGHGLGHQRGALQLRSAAGRKLAGLAAPYDRPAQFGDMVEIIRAGAFVRSLASGKDILCLVDHDPAKLLGRTKAGTLRLHDDWRGLSFEVDLPETQPANDMLALAERGDLGGMSFGFLCPKGCDLWGAGTRELLDVDLVEISVISSWPAYTNTTVEARCKGGLCGCSDLIQIGAPKLTLVSETSENLSEAGEVERLRLYLDTL